MIPPPPLPPRRFSPNATLLASSGISPKHSVNSIRKSCDNLNSNRIGSLNNLTKLDPFHLLSHGDSFSKSFFKIEIAAKPRLNHAVKNVNTVKSDTCVVSRTELDKSDFNFGTWPRKLSNLTQANQISLDKETTASNCNSNLKPIIDLDTTLSQSSSLPLVSHDLISQLSSPLLLNNNKEPNYANTNLPSKLICVHTL